LKKRLQNQYFQISIGIILFLFCSCSEKEKNPFSIKLPYYSSQIEIDGLKEYDTIVSWDWYNDNMADDRKCYRIQNSELGIVLERGMLPKRAEQINQMTIKIPIKPNKFGKLDIGRWLSEKKDMYSGEHPNYKFPIMDSMTIDGRKFGILSIERDYTDEYRIEVFYGTNINNEEIVFEFLTNTHKPDSFYLKTLNSMKTIKIKPTANTVYN
jgi:hypothetical protein